jgi:hypothetical protein
MSRPEQLGSFAGIMGGMDKRKIRTKWLDGERQAFADGLRCRAVRFQDRKKQSGKYWCRRPSQFPAD